MTEEEEIFDETQEAEEEAVEEEVEVPAPPPLKRARSKKEPAPEKAKEDLKQRVECQDCGRQVSLHTLRYGKHRCPGKKEAPVKPPLPR